MCTDPYATLSNWSGDREYQMEKKTYYSPDDIANLEALRNSEEVNVAIGFVKHIYQEWELDQKQKVDLSVQNIKELNELIESVSETSKNFRTIVESIITIRQQYAKMVEVSGRENVMRDPNLNLELLLLEEKLMAINVLNIQDIKNVRQMSSAAYEVRRVEEVLLMYLNIDKLNPIFTLIDKESIDVSPYKDSEKADPTKIAILLNLLSKMAALDRFVYHAADGRSLVNLRWEKTLTEQISPGYIPEYPLQEELNVSRIYRRVYSDLVTFVSRHQQKITTIFEQATSEDKIELMDAYCRLGMHVEAIVEGSQFENNLTIV
jgi:hypothetical protein